MGDSRIVFGEAPAPGRPPAIVALDLATGAIETLVDTLVAVGPYAGGPAWSPQRDRVIYADTGLVLLNLRSGRSVRITGGQFDFYPSFSPQGDQVAFGDGRILVATLSPWSVQALIGDDRFPSTQPRWSPDGGKIAFTAIQMMQNGPYLSSTALSQVWVVNRDGTGLAAVTPAGGHFDWPDWSPDGTRLAFVERPLTPYSEPGGADYLGEAYIWIANSDGSGAVRLPLPSPADTPRWSPDGLQLCFTKSSRGGFGEPGGLWVTDLSGLTARQVADNAVYPDW